MDHSMESTTSVASATTENVAPSKIGSSRRMVAQYNMAGEVGSSVDSDAFVARKGGGFNSSYVSI